MRGRGARTEDTQSGRWPALSPKKTARAGAASTIVTVQPQPPFPHLRAGISARRTPMGAGDRDRPPKSLSAV
jgi:hypothetical protein